MGYIRPSDLSVTTMQNWLYDVVEVERRIVVTDYVLNELERQIRTAGHVAGFAKPQKADASNMVPKFYTSTLPTIITVVAIVLGWFWCGYVIEGEGYGDGAFESFARGVDFFALSLSLIPISIITYLVSKPICTLLGRAAGEAEAERIYREEMDQWGREEFARQDEIARQLAKVPQFKVQRQAYTELRRMLNSRRSQLYSTGYLDESYRGLAPAAAMYGYLKSRRCTKVDGHGGLVDTYIHDQQFAILNGKLDTIISMLEDIRHTQAELAAAIDRNNSEMIRLRGGISSYAAQQHADNMQMIELQNYANQNLRWIAAAHDYDILTR